jgi:hypothetical protein
MPYGCGNRRKRKHPTKCPRRPRATRCRPQSRAAVRLSEFECQAWRLGDLVTTEILSTGDAVDFLYDAALANGLTGTHGEELIRDIVVQAVSGGFRQ